VNCIYIDPPYNTGRDIDQKTGWKYNDAVDDPKIRKWLGTTVGTEDLTRHDKWLCMMYPRLKLLHRLLSKDGVIFISIDDVEYAHLKLICDEIFGENNLLGTIVWNNATRTSDTIAIEHEYILCFAKNAKTNRSWKILRPEANTACQLVEEIRKNGGDIPTAKKELKAYISKLQKSSKDKKKYSWMNNYGNIDDNWRIYYAVDLSGEGDGPARLFADRLIPAPAGRHWMGQEYIDEAIEQERIVWRNNRAYRKLYIEESKESLRSNIQIPGRNGSEEIKAILGDKSFNNPKPTALIQQLIYPQLGLDGIILDSFAGSGTTAHAVLKLNAQDNGNRRFILIETMDYAETITAERVRRVMSGYGEDNKAVAGLSGSFDYYTVGERLLQENGMLNPAVGLSSIRDYVAWTEGIPIGQCAPLVPIATEGNAISPYWMGEVNNLGLFFVWEDKNPTTLDLSLLTQLVKQPGRYLIYADQCAMGEDFMRRHNITYKKIPRDITRL
jgi:adenine-specific DNA-methyltransferase